MTWDGLIAKTYDLAKDGEAVLRAHNANIIKFIADAYFDDVGGHKVPVVNVPYHYASDTAHELLAKYPDAPFAACWFRRSDGMIQYSLRSEDSRVDEIAKTFGGGGHRNAAGYQVAACKTCRFWWSWEFIGRNGYGKASVVVIRRRSRRYSKSVGGDTDRATPVTGQAYWCGEWKSGPRPTEDAAPTSDERVA